MIIDFWAFLNKERNRGRSKEEATVFIEINHMNVFKMQLIRVKLLQIKSTYSNNIII